METETWLTRDELANRTKIAKQTLAQWASQGKGPRYAKFGRHVRYSLADVLAWERAAMAGAHD